MSEFAEVAVPAASSLAPSWAPWSSSPRPSAMRWTTSTRCSAALLEAGLLALGLALVLGYWMASLFARRICAPGDGGRADRRRPLRRADRRPAPDELGELARAFDRMRLRLSQLERARREFVGNASHELRTPLFSLRGFIELLTDEELDEATRREFLETMGEQVTRLQRLAEDLLDLTRLDAGRMHIERSTVDLAEVAQDLAEEFRAVAAATAHPLEVEALGGACARRRAGGSCASAGRSSKTRSSTRLRALACRVRSPARRSSVEDEGPGITKPSMRASLRPLLPRGRGARVRERAWPGDRARARNRDGRHARARGPGRLDELHAAPSAGAGRGRVVST